MRKPAFEEARQFKNSDFSIDLENTCTHFAFNSRMNVRLQFMFYELACS